jgi:hypothetical protein
MEKFQELREEAKKKLKVADHMLTMTYPLVQDNKLLLAVMQNIFLALTYAMGSILHYERTFKTIPPFQDNFSSKFNMFRAKIVDRYKIDKQYVDFIEEVKDVIVQHKESPVEFVRKDRFVICSDDYKMKTISTETMKEYLYKTKSFLIIASKIVNKEEEIFNKKEIKFF